MYSKIYFAWVLVIKPKTKENNRNRKKWQSKSFAHPMEAHKRYLSKGRSFCLQNKTISNIFYELFSLRFLRLKLFAYKHCYCPKENIVANINEIVCLDLLRKNNSSIKKLKSKYLICVGKNGIIVDDGLRHIN